MITELAPTKSMNKVVIEFKVDLTQDHDVIGAYHKIDFSEVRAKYRDPGTRYAFAVLDGITKAGYMTKLAAFRHLRDLQRIGKSDFSYHYSKKEIKRLLKVASVVPNVDTGKPTELMPWQKFIMCMLIGWRNEEGGKRFTVAIISVSRGQGKTYILAILMVYSFLFESLGLSNQDFLVSSINFKQTSKLFGYVKTMLKAVIKIEPFKTIAAETGLTDRTILNDEVIMKKMNNKIRAISHEAGQYDSFHFTTAIFDEIGEISTRDKISKIVSGQVLVKNKQFVQISTSYPDPTVPFRKDQKTLQEVMEKDWDREADTSLCLVWSQDDLSETFDPETWVKSNPLLDLEGKKTILLKGLIDKRNSDLLQGTLHDFQTKNLNMWLQQDIDSYLNLDDVERAIIPEFNIQGKRCYAGIDYSMASDNTAIAFVFPYLDDDENQKWHVEQHSFVPFQQAGSIEAKEKQDGINYRDLEKQGFCTITSHPQGLINDDEVYEWIVNYIEDNSLDIIFFGYDTMGVTKVIQMLANNTGFNLQPIRQRTSELKEPTKFLQKIFVEGSISRLDDKITEKALLNAVLREDSIGIQVDKRKATLKIDVVDAIIDALYQGMYHFEDFGVANDKSWQVEHMTPEQVKEWFTNDESGLLNETENEVEDDWGWDDEDF
ncbi:terminase large subunit [Lactococcus garvieae]|uniref:terminase large subunit n=1 Tax=Lactococcus garvieae TaxID=1363 RepID=UPI003853195F